MDVSRQWITWWSNGSQGHFSHSRGGKKNHFGQFFGLKNDSNNKLWIKNATEKCSMETLFCYLTTAVALFGNKTQKIPTMWRTRNLSREGCYCETSTWGMCSTFLWFKHVFCAFKHSLCWMYIPEVITQLSKPQLGETKRQESDLSQKAHIFGILDIFVSWVNKALAHHHFNATLNK